MRYYGSIEEANKAAHQRVNDYRSAAQHYAAMCNVFKSFDNKVFNCRLEKALYAATSGRIHVNKTETYLEIYAYPEHGYSFHITLAHIATKDMPDGKRIPADKLIESAQKYREETLRKAYELEASIDQVPQIKAYLYAMKDKLESYVRSFPDDLRDIYSLPYCIRMD